MGAHDVFPIHRAYIIYGFGWVGYRLCGVRRSNSNVVVNFVTRPVVITRGEDTPCTEACAHYCFSVYVTQSSSMATGDNIKR